MISAVSHVDHEKRVPWFSITMHACGSIPKVMGFLLMALLAAGALLLVVSRILLVY